MPTWPPRPRSCRLVLMSTAAHRGGGDVDGGRGGDRRERIQPPIRAVVAEGATARVADDEAWLSDSFGWRGFVQEQLERLQDVVTGALTTATAPSSMRSAVESSGGTRYLLITAGDVDDEGRAAVVRGVRRARSRRPSGRCRAVATWEGWASNRWRGRLGSWGSSTGPWPRRDGDRHGCRQPSLRGGERIACNAPHDGRRRRHAG